MKLTLMTLSFNCLNFKSFFSFLFLIKLMLYFIEILVSLFHSYTFSLPHEFQKHFVKRHEKSYWNLIQIALDVQINLGRKKVFTILVLVILALSGFLYLLGYFKLSSQISIFYFIFHNILKRGNTLIYLLMSNLLHIFGIKLFA